MVTDPPPTGSTIVPAPRKKLDSEFNDEENKLEMTDTQAEIILSQGLPRHIFNILNQTSTAQEIWNNVELLMQGSGRTLQQRKEDLFDEYERFRAIGNESIHDYFVRFHKLVNDMKITQLEIPTHQMNTKFVNNLPAYWEERLPAQEKGDLLDAEAEAFLADVECTAPYDQPQALTTTNMFQANHEDAYDSDVDEGPNAAVAFMANLSSTSATNNQVNEVHSNDNQILDNVDYQLSRGYAPGEPLELRC
ncbi:hypothetical protein Tco_0072413 [Tanacetum coccineum]